MKKKISTMVLKNTDKWTPDMQLAFKRGLRRAKKPLSEKELTWNKTLNSYSVEFRNGRDNKKISF